MSKTQYMMTIAVLFLAGRCNGAIVAADALVRPENSLIVDVKVTASGAAAQVFVTYWAPGIEPLVSARVPVSTTGLTTITIGRLRANRTYTYTVSALDRYGAPAGTIEGMFTTGSLPPVLLQNTYRLQGRMTPPLVILPHGQTVAGVGSFQGFVAFDLHGPDAPQIVWYYSNAPSTASGTLQIDSAPSIVREPNGTFLFADGGTGGPTAADSFYREIAPDGTILVESPADCSVTPPLTTQPRRWIWGQGNDIHEEIPRGADGVSGTVLHLGEMVKDPFFDAGLSPQGIRLQMGTAIRRWNPATGVDTVVWDPFNFLNPLTERTDASNSDPTANSGTRGPMPCRGAALSIEEWTHSNSLQVAPTGEILQSVRHLDTVLAISPKFDRINWRIGRFGSNFSFPNPGDRFYHQHFVRMLPNRHLLLFDNGNGRPAAEGGQYSRALELDLNRDSMTATKVWEYRHPLASGYKYASAAGSAERLENGNTLVLFGTDFDPATLRPRSPQVFSLVEANSNREAFSVATLDMIIPGAPIMYRATPIRSLFGEAVCLPPVLTGVAANPSVLWPPNGQLAGITVSYEAQSACPVTNALTVSSSEPPDPGQQPEWNVLDAHHVQLRADRLGAGSGRTYTITITSSNAAGIATQTATVFVPHDQGR
jgi:hypothetical protein